MNATDQLHSCNSATIQFTYELLQLYIAPPRTQEYQQLPPYRFSNHYSRLKESPRREFNNNSSTAAPQQLLTMFFKVSVHPASSCLDRKLYKWALLTLFQRMGGKVYATPAQNEETNSYDYTVQCPSYRRLNSLVEPILYPCSYF